MKALCLLFLILGAPLAADTVASNPTPEALVGEDRGVPTAVPTPAADEGGPRMVSRTQQGAPSFALPAFVVTGGGERQDLVQRGDLGSALDTSGGIKTSPGETGAGQDQRATEAVRATPEDETYTPREHYGELTASYGLRDTLNVDGLLGGEQGPWYGWLEGGTHSSDGGPLPSSALEPAERRDSEVAGQGGWRMDPDDLFELAGEGGWRSLRLTDLPGDHWEERNQGGGSADWEGDWLGLTQHIQVQGHEAHIDLPGYTYTEDGGGFDATVQKSLGPNMGGGLLEGGLDLDLLSQQGSLAGRTFLISGIWAEGHFEPWSGGRLGLGLRADWDAGATSASAFQPGPILDFEQRLAQDLGLRLEFGTGLELSSLQGDAFHEDPLLPNPTLHPSRRVADFKASLPWQPLPGLSLEAGGFVRQDEGAFLPGVAPEGLWADTSVGTLRVDGFSLSERYGQDPWWQNLDIVGQQGVLEGSNLVATFLPPWKASGAIGYRLGPWSAQTGFKAQGYRQASLLGDWVIPPQWDWQIRGGYDVGDYLTLFVEGDSLAGAVYDWPGYTDPSPYLGLGAKLRF